MSLYDDMFDLDDHFKNYVKNPDKLTTCSIKERRGIKEAWKRINESHADHERALMKTEPVVEAISTILNAFGVERKVE